MKVMLRLDGCFTNCNCFVGTKLCTSWISFYSCTTHYRFNTTTQHQWSWWKYKETDNQFLYIFYIFYLHISSFIIKTSSFTGEERRSRERIMSICLTWFLIGWFRRTQYITQIGLIYNNMGFYLEVLWLCEELVGVTWRFSDSVKN